MDKVNLDKNDAHSEIETKVESKDESVKRIADLEAELARITLLLSQSKIQEPKVDTTFKAESASEINESNEKKSEEKSLETASKINTASENASNANGSVSKDEKIDEVEPEVATEIKIGEKLSSSEESTIIPKEIDVIEPDVKDKDKKNESFSKENGENKKNNLASNLVESDGTESVEVVKATASSADLKSALKDLDRKENGSDDKVKSSTEKAIFEAVKSEKNIESTDTKSDLKDKESISVDFNKKEIVLENSGQKSIDQVDSETSTVSAEKTKKDSEKPESTKVAEAPADENAPSSVGASTENDGSENEDVTDQSLLHKPHAEVVLKLADQQADVNSPLYSVTTFEELGLSKELLKGIYTMGFKKPSKIQEKALPLLISNPPKNMIGQSQSGTGKTAAFVLNLLTRVEQSDKSLQGICLAPSRELARQIMDVAKAMSQFTNIKLNFAIKKEQGTKHSKIDSQIVIGTPGTVLNMIQLRLMSVKNVKVFVLDEADTMVNTQGNQDETLRIQRLLPSSCQNVLFSATFPDKVRFFAQKYAPNANEISLQVKELTIKAIKQFYIDCANQNEKVLTLLSLYSIMTIGQSIIFVNSKALADQLHKVMTSAKHRVITLHGSQTPADRDAMVDTFRSGACKVMITTNVVARGLDISQVNLVVNFDVPTLSSQGSQPDYETYLHRIGRTGRFGKSGVAINFVSDQSSLFVVRSFENHFGIKIQLLDPKKLNEAEELLHKALK